MAVTKYIEVRNNDNIVTIDDNYRNLVRDGKSFRVRQYKKYNSRPEFVPSNNEIYQYFKDENNWDILITFDVDESINEILAFSAPADELVKFFPLRIQDRYMINIIVPFDAIYGDRESSLQVYLGRISFAKYNNRDLTDPEHGAGLIIYNKDGKPIFSSEEQYLRVLQYYFKCTEKLTDAQQVFEKTILDFNNSIKIAPFSACNFWRYTPQVTINYRLYITFLSMTSIKIGVHAYGGFFNQGEFGISGAIQVTTSFMVLQG